MKIGDGDEDGGVVHIVFLADHWIRDIYEYLDMSTTNDQTIKTKPK